MQKITIKIETADTDFGGVCHHAEILKKFEQGRDSLLVSVGYQHAREWKRGKVLPVVSMESLRFHSPLFLGETYVVHTVIIGSSKERIDFKQWITCEDGKVCVMLNCVRMIYADREAKQRERLPEYVLAGLKGYADARTYIA